MARLRFSSGYLNRNGRKTMMKASALMLALAGILCACAPQNEVINYRTYTDPEKGIFYIVDSVLDKGELISGVGTDQTRVVITRQGR
jgi:hypothetical protein